MELRSSRSRSKTPFVVSHEAAFDTQAEMAKGVEKTVTRVTRSTISTATRNEERRQIRKKGKITVTSDYSSAEDADEVNSATTTRPINRRSARQMEKENVSNHFLEEARLTAVRETAERNRSSPALELYRKMDRYWDETPKTDWTYSRHSKDRIELAPGVVAMPNMSRRNIHSDCSNSEEDYSTTTATSIYTTQLINQSTNTDSNAKFLYNNNKKSASFESDEIVKRRWRHDQQLTITQTIWHYCQVIVTTIVSVLWAFHSVQVGVFAKLHNLASRLMLLDCWLLRVNSRGRFRNGEDTKWRNVLILCLLPLVLLLGWWLFSLLSTTAGAILSTLSTTSGHLVNTDQISSYFNINPWKYESNNKNDKIKDYLTADQLQFIINTIKTDLQKEINENREINVENLIGKIIQNNQFQSIMANNKNKDADDDENNNKIEIENQKAQFAALQSEINKLKLDLNENFNNQENLKVEIKNCCHKNLDLFIKTVLIDLLNDNEFLKNQNGFNAFLSSKKEEKLNEFEKFNDFDKLNEFIKNNEEVLFKSISNKIRLEIKNDMQLKSSGQIDVNTIGEDRIRQLIAKSLKIYDADKTGLVDYALESMGGQILTTRCTEMYHSGKAVVSVLGIPLWYPVNSPRTVITPGLSPGECWAFQSFPGFLVIKLSNDVAVEAFSLEHISKLLVPNEKIDSAPKDFEVWGLESENDREGGVLLGSYTFDYEGEELQYFPVADPSRIFRIVELRILSNHGNPNYTCLYRFRVHGKAIN